MKQAFNQLKIVCFVQVIRICA